MSRSIYSHAMTCRNRLFVSALGALVLILGSTIWSPAFAWDPYIGPEITTLPPEFRDDPSFSAIPVKWQWSYTFRHLLDNGSVESAGYAAGEKVNFRVRSYATGIGSVRLELTGSQTASRTDNTWPYSLFEDIAGQSLPAGSYEISITAYPEPDLGGTPGTTRSATFTLVTDTTAPSVRVLFGEYAPATDTGTEIELAISEPPVAFWEEGTQFTNVRRDPIASVKRNRMGGLSYVFNVEPQSTGGEATVMVPAGVIEDESGNANTASETLHVARNRGLSVADSSAMEGTDGTLDFEVTLDARNDCETVTVDWSTADGTATAGEDYSAASGTLTFGPGETTKTVSVAILDDEVEDTGETFTLRLSNALGVSIASNTSGVTIADAEATGTINNDESQQQVTSDTEPPTGLPAISGTARVGKTLTASVSEIADADGLTGVSYAYQWIANDGSTDTDIASATAASYMLVAGDVGKTVKVRVTFTDGGGTEETLTSAATGAVVAANSLPTGLPTIAGTAQVGETLTAAVSGIADEDGLTGATYAYQWITDDGTSDTDIAGATEASYTLTSAEAGKTVKVRVTFTDDGGTEETLTSAATAAVVVPLTGEFLDMPDDGHDGSTAFTFELKFSEEISISYVTLRDSAFEVIGGSVTGARRLEQGKNQRWEITVELDTQEDLTIALPVGPACGEPNAICTAGRKQLSRRLEATVPGPASTTAQEEPASTTVMRTLWSSTLTVGQPDFLGFIGSGNGGSLSSAGWSESGRAHTVGGVNLALFGLSSDRPNELWVELSPTPGNLDGLTLHVGGRAHALSEAVVTGNRFAWPVGGLTWAAGDRVFLRLVRTVEVAAPGTGLSVADVEMREGPNAVLRFPVTLTPASSSTVTVDYATSDGTAEAGADYTETSGTLTFAPGETKKTIPVAVLDDDHDEGMETLTLTLSGASGAEIAAASAAGRIVNTDAMPKAWLARFGRTVAGQVIDAVEARLTAPPWAGVEASLAGQALPRWNADGRADGTARTDAAHAGAQEEAGAGARLAALSDWLQGDWREDPGSGSGAGVATVGLLLAHSRGEGGYRGAQAGTVSSTVTGLYPYGRYMVNPRVTLWGVAGYGAGTLTLTPEKGDAMRTDLELMMAAAGVRGVAVEAPADGGFELAVTSDAMAVRTASEKVAGLVAATADVTLLRLGLEGSWRGLAAGGGELTPRLEVGLRLDGGDAETGFGADIGGGLAWSHAKSGVTADIGARGLLTHEAGGFRETGISGSFAWEPDPSRGRGPKLTLTQTLGGASSGGMDALLGRGTLAGLAANDNDEDALQQRRLELRFGYGFPAFGDGFTSTPELGLGLSNGHREYSLGWGLNMAGGGANSLELRLEATRRESANDNADAEHAIGLRLTSRF